MNNLKPLCFSSFGFGSYQKYIPYYIFSIWKTHPDSAIKIFIEKPLESNIEKTLTYLKEQGIENFEVIIWKSSLEDYQTYKIKGGGKKIIRWVLGPEYFEGFEFVYIGDVDILFLPEKKSIIDFHVNQLSNLKLPFSNKVRYDKNQGLSKRLTGLHFFKTKEYFDKINPIILRIKNDKTYRDDYLEGLERDENLLYKINQEAFDFDPLIVSKAQRPWHGLHLGITRGNKDLDVQTIEENSSLSLNEVKKHLSDYINDPIFKGVQSKVFVVELEAILKELLLPYSLPWKYKGFKYRSHNKWRLIKRKIKEYLR